MILASLNRTLINAQSGHYAVGSFNVLDLQSIKAVIRAAEHENSPVIMAFGEGHERFVPMEEIFPIMLKYAIKSTAPVVVLLDHGSYEANIRAMNLGVKAVMYDGSSLSFEENIEKTKKIVEYAHPLSISVEAELGHVSMEEGNPELMTHEIDQMVYTDPSLVREFIFKTEIDALAISIGTVHGIGLNEPKLDFERLKEIREITDVPLVLHGGSGVSDDDFKKCIQNGISKINYFSDISNLVAINIKEKLLEKADKSAYYQNIVKWAQETFENVIRDRMRVFGSSNKA